MTHLVGCALVTVILLASPAVAPDARPPADERTSPFDPQRMAPRRAPARLPAPGPERAKGSPEPPAEEERAPDPPSPLWPPPGPPDASESSLA
jgi:hypothetical protein